MSDKDLCLESGTEIPSAVPPSARPVFLPLLALLILTLVTQLASLPYIMGRAEQMPNATEQSFLYMAVAAVIIVFMLTIPLAGLGSAGFDPPSVELLAELFPQLEQRDFAKAIQEAIIE